MTFRFCFKNPEFSYESMRKEVEDEIQEINNYLAENNGDLLRPLKKEDCIERIRELTSLLDRLAEMKKEEELREERDRRAYEAMDTEKKNHLDALAAKLIIRKDGREEERRALSEDLTPIYEFITEEQLDFLDAIPGDLIATEKMDITDYLQEYIDLSCEEDDYSWDATRRRISERLKVRYQNGDWFEIENGAPLPNKRTVQ